jgi:thymidylate synthase (FAD)
VGVPGPCPETSPRKTIAMTTEPTEPSHLQRPRVEALDKILGHAFKVLDDGFVRVVDYMGDDTAIVQAARVSYGEGTKRVQEDRGLIRYLMRHRHTTPFEMCEIKLHVRVPMDCWRQWIRHRTANVNEYSTRYSIAIDRAQITEPNAWRSQATRNRQGSDDVLAESSGQALSSMEQELQRRARGVYEERIRAGVAREQARKDLPLSTYTEAYWKVDLHNLFHFLALRMDAHAQVEIRAYAHLIGTEIVSAWCPQAWQAFMDYQVSALSLSRAEAQLIRLLQMGDLESAGRLATSEGWTDDDGTPKPNSRERNEVEAKLQGLGIVAPWTEG